MKTVFFSFPIDWNGPATLGRADGISWSRNTRFGMPEAKKGKAVTYETISDIGFGGHGDGWLQNG